MLEFILSCSGFTQIREVDCTVVVERRKSVEVFSLESVYTGRKRPSQRPVRVDLVSLVK